VAVSAIVFSVIYMLWAYQRVFHGPLRAAVAADAGPVTGKVGGRDISWREIWAIAPLLAGIVFLGVFPKPFLDRVTPSVANVLAHVQHVDPSFHIPSQGLTQAYAVPADQNVNTGVRP